MKWDNQRNVKDTSCFTSCTVVPRGPKVSYPQKHGWQTWIASREVCNRSRTSKNIGSEIKLQNDEKPRSAASCTMHFHFGPTLKSRVWIQGKQQVSARSIHQCKWKQMHILKVQKAHHSAKLGQSKWRTWALLSCKYPVGTLPLLCPNIPNQSFCVWLSCHRSPLLHVSTHLCFVQSNSLGEVPFNSLMALQIQRTSCIQQSGCEQPISWSRELGIETW